MKNLFVIGLLLGSISFVGNANAMDNKIEDPNKSVGVPVLFWNEDEMFQGEKVIVIPYIGPTSKESTKNDNIPPVLPLTSDDIFDPDEIFKNEKGIEVPYIGSTKENYKKQ